MKKLNSQMSENTTTEITEHTFFCSVFLTRKWGWMGCGFYRMGFMKEQRHVRGLNMLYICFTLLIRV